MHLNKLVLGNMRSNFAENQNLRNLGERENTHKIVNGVRPAFAYVSGPATDLLLSTREIFTSSQLTPDPKYTQEITLNFL